MCRTRLTVAVLGLGQAGRDGASARRQRRRRRWRAGGGTCIATRMRLQGRYVSGVRREWISAWAWGGMVRRAAADLGVLSRVVRRPCYGLVKSARRVPARLAEHMFGG